MPFTSDWRGEIKAGKIASKMKARAATQRAPRPPVLTCKEIVDGAPCRAPTVAPNIARCVKHGGSEVLDRMKYIRQR